MGSIWRIAATIIGTMVGAGFATGQEIMHFFTKYGWIGYVTIAITSVLFGHLCAKLLIGVHTHRVRSYVALNQQWFGHRGGMIVSLGLSGAILAISMVMLAGAGAVCAEQWGVSPIIGICVLLVVAYGSIRRGIRSIMHIHALIVPLLIGLLVGLLLWTGIHAPTFTKVASFSAFAPWTAMILYVAFNITTSQTLLVSVGRSIPDRRFLRAGGWIGGLGMGVLLCVGHHLLWSNNLSGSVPLGQLAKTIGPVFGALYASLTIAEIASTLIGNLYGIATTVPTKTEKQQRLFLALVLAGCGIGSGFGFIPLLQTVYPMLGAISLVWMIKLMLWKVYPDTTDSNSPQLASK